MVEMILLLVATILHILDRGIYFAQLVVYHLLICIRNARKLYFMLLNGTKTWIYMLGRLIMFTMVLAPGWYNLLKYWFFDSFILRNIEYGKGAKYRNVMDIYLPLPMTVLHQLRNDAKTYPDGAPVVIFVSGGAWIIGYKLWSALVGRALACFGILTIVPDYRNFPQGDIKDMTQDVRSAILWTEANAYRFGGNPDKIILAGQSAGAHICMCLLVEEFLQKKRHAMNPGDYDDKMATNYHVFDEIVGHQQPQKTQKTPSPAKRQLTVSSDKISSTTAANDVAPLLSPSRVKVLATDTSLTGEKGVAVEEDDEEGEVETPYFQHYPIFPIKERRSLEQLLSSAPLTSASHEKPGREAVGKEEAMGGSTVSWFNTPCDAEIGHDEELSEVRTANTSEERRVDEEEDWESSAGEKSVWRDVNDEDLLQAAVETSLMTHLEGSGATAVRRSENQNQPKRSSTIQQTLTQLKSQVERKMHQHHHAPRISEKVKLFIGVSGPYNLQALEAHLHKRGLDSSILHWICRGNLVDSSPTVQLQQYVINELLGENGELEKLGMMSEITTTAYEVHSTTVATTITSSAASTTATVTSTASSGMERGEGNESLWGWPLMNLLKSEVNLYLHKLFSPNNRLSFQFLSASQRDINSSDDVIVGGASSGLSAKQIEVLHGKSLALADFPPVALFHGEKDVSIPASISEELAEVLKDHGARLLYKAYPEWSHTDAILEAPLYGNTKLFKDMIRIIRQVTETSSFPSSNDGVTLHSFDPSRKRAMSFPADSSHLMTKFAGVQLLQHRSFHHSKTSQSSAVLKEGDSQGEQRLLRSNPSETPLAPKFLLDFARSINPF